MNKKIGSFKGNIQQSGMVIALVFICILFEILTNGNLLTAMNISNMVLQNSYIICLSVGMYFCILTGNVDLSVGRVLGFTGAVLGWLIVKNQMNVWLSIILILLLGIAIGAWNGFFIAKFKVPPFIATLAAELVFQGATLWLLQGHSLSPFPEKIQFIAAGFLFSEAKVGGFNVFAIAVGIISCLVVIYLQVRDYKKHVEYNYDIPAKPMVIAKTAAICAVILFLIIKLAQVRGIPFVLVLLLGVVLIYNFVATKTVFGRHVFALGGNAKAAALSGVKTAWIMFAVYVNSAFLAAVGSILVCARLNAASTSAGTGYELDAIAACYIGGCAAAGGEGSLFGVVVGALVMGVLNCGMSLMGIGTDIQHIVKGLILLLAVTFDIYSKSKSN